MASSPSIPALISAAASAAGVSPSLALAVANQESGFNQAARGTSGEIGVFQLMPGTAASLGVDPTNLQQNIQGGVTYLGQQLSAFADPWQAVAAYNAGPGTVQNAISVGGANWFAYIPASTQAYVTSVLGSAPPTSSVTMASAAASAAASGGSIPAPASGVPLGLPTDSGNGDGDSLDALFGSAPTSGFSGWGLVAVVGAGIGLVWALS